MPLGRGGEPHEVAFLANDVASYVTGAALPVDGGQLASKFGTWSEDRAELRSRPLGAASGYQSFAELKLRAN